jgi:hypothetical protein
MFDPLLGQFMSADPILQMPYSQGLNRYAYVHNSPLNYVDPSGFSATQNDYLNVPTVTVGAMAAGSAVGYFSSSAFTATTASVAASAAPIGAAAGAGTGLGTAILFNMAFPTGVIARHTSTVMSSRGGIAAGRGAPSRGRVAPVDFAPVQERSPGIEQPDWRVPEELQGPDNRQAAVPCDKAKSVGPGSCDATAAMDFLPMGGTAAKGAVKGAPAAQRVLINLLRRWAPKVLQWSSHGGKHIANVRIPWPKVLASTAKGPAKYHPGINVEALERKVWAAGTRVTNGKPWKVMDMGTSIGASGGKVSQWVRVELSAGTIHGHPITFEEFVRLITP